MKASFARDPRFGGKFHDHVILLESIRGFLQRGQVVSLHFTSESLWPLRQGLLPSRRVLSKAMTDIINTSSSLLGAIQEYVINENGLSSFITL